MKLQNNRKYEKKSKEIQKRKMIKAGKQNQRVNIFKLQGPMDYTCQYVFETKTA